MIDPSVPVGPGVGSIGIASGVAVGWMDIACLALHCAMLLT